MVQHITTSLHSTYSGILLQCLISQALYYLWLGQPLAAASLQLWPSPLMYRVAHTRIIFFLSASSLAASSCLKEMKSE